MAIIYGSGGSVTVSGAESATGKTTTVTPTSSTATKPATSSTSATSTSSSHDTRTREEKRLENIEQIAALKPGYKETISYQETKAELTKKTTAPTVSNVKVATTTNVSEATKDLPPGSPNLVKVGEDYYYKSETGVVTRANIVAGQPYNPYSRFVPSEKTTGTTTINGQTFEVVTVTQRTEVPTGTNTYKIVAEQRRILRDPATGEVVYDVKEGKLSPRVIRQEGGYAILPSGQRYEGYAGYQEAGGYITGLRVSKGGITTTFSPFSGETLTLQNVSTYMDFSLGKGYDIAKNMELNPFKTADYLQLKKLGVSFKFDEEALGSTEWYASETDIKAAQDARSLAYSTAQAINAQYEAEVVKVTESNGVYTVELIESAKSTGFPTTLRNAITGYSKVNKYAQAVEESPGKFTVSPKTMTEESYLKSKAYAGNMPVQLSIDQGSLEPELTFMSGETKHYSELTPLQQQLFDVEYGAELDRMAKDITYQLGTQGIVVPTGFYKEGGTWKLKGLQNIGAEMEAPETTATTASLAESPALTQIYNMTRMETPTQIPSGTIIEDRYGVSLGGGKNTLIQIISSEARTNLAEASGTVLELTGEPQTIGGKLNYQVAQFWKGMEGWAEEVEGYSGGAQEFAEPIVRGFYQVSPMAGTQYLAPEKFEEVVKRDTEFITRFTGNVAHAAIGVGEAGTFFVPLAAGGESVLEAKITGQKDTTAEAGAFGAAIGYSAAGVTSLPRTFGNLAALTIAPGAYLTGGTLSGGIEGGMEYWRTGKVTYGNVQTSFEAGGISSVATLATFQATKAGLGILGTGGVVNYGKRIVGASITGGMGGGSYIAIKAPLTGREPTTEELAYYTLVGAGLGGAFETARIGFETGIIPRPVWGKVKFSEEIPNVEAATTTKPTYVPPGRGEPLPFSTTTVEHGYSGVGISWMGKNYPVVGLQDWGLRVGQPVWNVKGVLSYPTSQELPGFQTQILKPTYEQYIAEAPYRSAEFKQLYLKHGGYGFGTTSEFDDLYLQYVFPEGQEFTAAETRFRTGFELMEYTYYDPHVTSTKMTLKEVLEEMPRLQVKGAPETVIRVMEREKAGLLLGGSTTQRIFMGEAARMPHDIDIHIISALDPETLAKEFYEELRPIYGAGNIKIMEGSKIYVKSQGASTFEKLLEISSETTPAPSASEYASAFGEGEVLGYGFKRPPPFTTPEGYAIFSFEEQAVRKGESAIRWHGFGVAPDVGRLKDVGDFLTHGEFKAGMFKSPEAAGLVSEFKSTIPQNVMSVMGQEEPQLVLYAQKYYAAAPLISKFPVSAIIETTAEEPAYGYTGGYEYSTGGYQIPAGYAQPSFEYKTYPSVKYEASPVYAPSPKYTPYSPKYNIPSAPYYPKYTAPPSPTYYQPPTKQYYPPSKPYSPPYSPKYSPPSKPYYAPPSKPYSPPYSPQYSPKYSPPSKPYYYLPSKPYSQPYSPKYSPPTQYKTPPPPPPYSYLPSGGLANKFTRNVEPKRVYNIEGERSIYADLLSVAKSQYRYGKATHPNPLKRPGIYEYERSFIPRVPTVEMLNRKRKTKTFKGIKANGGKRFRP